MAKRVVVAIVLILGVVGCSKEDVGGCLPVLSSVAQAASGSCSCSRRADGCGVDSNNCQAPLPHPSCTRTLLGQCTCDCQM